MHEPSDALATIATPVRAGRLVTPERMDDPGLDPVEHRRALAGLARLNRISGSAADLYRAVADLLPRSGETPLRILDLATGGGDVAIGLWRRVRRAGRAVEILATDRSDLAIADAMARASAVHAGVRFSALDACSDALPEGHDVVMTSLFLHHLDDELALDLLRRMKRAAKRRVIVNDLARGRVNEAMVFAAARLVTRSPIVHADGPQSVRAAFTPVELRRIAEQAGLTGARVRRVFPCRMMLCWDAT